MLANKKISPAIKWHGGKNYLTKQIIALMRPHVHYVEPYFGGGSLLFAKDPEGISEVVNDINGDLTNFWKVLQGVTEFAAFRRNVEATPFSETEFVESAAMLAERHRGLSPSVCDAVRFFIVCRQSMSGRMKDFAPTSRTRTRRGMNEQVSAWLTAIEGLPAVHARLKRVLIQNREAIDCIKSEDGPDTLFYCDPPYLHETRTAKDVYAHEMKEGEHCNLLAALAEIRGGFLLSGYRSETYDAFAKAHRWHRHDFEIDNKAAKGKTKRKMIECVWSNYKVFAT